MTERDAWGALSTAAHRLYVAANGKEWGKAKAAFDGVEEAVVALEEELDGTAETKRASERPTEEK